MAAESGCKNATIDLYGIIRYHPIMAIVKAGAILAKLFPRKQKARVPKSPLHVFSDGLAPKHPINLAGVIAGLDADLQFRRAPLRAHAR